MTSNSDKSQREFKLHPAEEVDWERRGNILTGLEKESGSNWLNCNFGGICLETDGWLDESTVCCEEFFFFLPFNWIWLEENYCLFRLCKMPLIPHQGHGFWFWRAGAGSWKKHVCEQMSHLHMFSLSLDGWRMSGGVTGAPLEPALVWVSLLHHP